MRHMIYMYLYSSLFSHDGYITVICYEFPYHQGYITNLDDGIGMLQMQRPGGHFLTPHKLTEAQYDIDHDKCW
jgi:hypothetical protein